MADEKILISQEVFLKITSILKVIKVTSKDKDIIKEIEGILCSLEDVAKEESISVVEKIQQKMKEMKNIDADAHANLYILYRKLMDNKISEAEALKLFEMYNNNASYNKFASNKIYL